MANIKVVLTSHGKGQVFVDGVKMDGVIGVKVSAKVGEPNLCSIELIAAEIEISGEFDVSTIDHELVELVVGGG